jgi:hypothetical protein
MEFDVTVEIPTGTRNKYVMDRRTGRITPCSPGMFRMRREGAGSETPVRSHR